MDKTTISNLIKVSFDKFKNDNIKLEINTTANTKEPSILFKDEILYGVGNIIQNAIQHANSIVNVNIFWNLKEFVIQIVDDGKGFNSEILDKIGKPYISKQNKGMGLGIFIAKNLIENINGSIEFKNVINKNGGCVEIKIKRVT